MKLKSIFISLVFFLIFVSCNKENNSQKKKVEGFVISERTKEFSIFAIHLGKAFNGELPVYKKAFDMTNVKLKGIASKNQTDEELAFNLMVSSGELPDIIAYEFPLELEKLGASGKMIPLESLIDLYAPNIKKFWDENPNYKKDAVAADGHIYMIPNYNDCDNINTTQGYYIRKDWLRKLGLQEPKTVDELYKILIAFRDEDPNGNGKKDEIPIFVRGNTTRIVLSSLVDIFKAHFTWYDKNGTGPIFGPSEEEYKNAIKQLSKWYKEGLIDKEIFTRNIMGRDYILSNNLGGFTCDWFSSTGDYNKKLKETIPNFDFSTILPLEYKGKNKTSFARENYLGGWGISSSAKDPVAIIKYFDFWYSEEGRRLWNFGIEGEDYVLFEGKPYFTDKILRNREGKTSLEIIRETGAQYRLGMFQDATNERQWAESSVVKAIDLYRSSNVIEKPMPILKYTKEEMEEMSKISKQLNKITEEMAQIWILGVSDVEKDWDEYLYHLNIAGLEKAKQIQKQAYKRFTGK